MLAKAPRRQHLEQHEFIQRGGRQDRDDLLAQQRLEQRRLGGDVAEPQCGAQGLAKARVVNDARQARQLREPRRVSGVEMALHIVFGDEESMPLGEQQHAVQIGCAAAPAGRVV